jgi:hypothetical protein
VSRARLLALALLCAAHAASAYEPIDHAKTRFPLTGKHRPVSCESCHPSAGGGNRKWTGIPRDCHGCHGDRKNHKGALGAACERCHTPDGWTTLQHDPTQHHLPLTGPHKLECASCHAAGAHLQPKAACADCHKQPHGGTKAPCETCHRAETWKTAAFKHKVKLDQLLPGKHRTATCLGCHPSFQFAGSNLRCESCHFKDLKHDDLGECGKCHTPLTWRKQANFDHDRPPISFPLAQKHAGVACIQCHKVKDVFTGASRACESCHLGPKHGDLGPCAKCHTTAGFAKPGFDHAGTRFPLDGKHGGVACATCHARFRPGTFTPGPAACAACHTDPHKAQFAPRTCSDCHTARGFDPSTVDAVRHASFRYPLKGAHLTTPCASCHKNGVFVAAPTACRDCHTDRHRGVLGPNCERCHEPTAWGKRAVFDHGARTGFPLVGSHAQVQCEKCHGPNDARMKAIARPITCTSCHTPKHGPVYGPDCARCHTITRFSDGRRFDHSRTLFPLERRHKAIACASCHDPKKRPPDPNCQSCHGDPHGGRTFLDCGECHRADSWLLIRYDHDRAEFPLKGRHFFTPCRDCHTNDVWTALRRDCVSCHRGDRQRADMLHPDHAQLDWTCIDCHRPWDWNARP